MAEVEPAAKISKHTWTLEKETELRIQVAENSDLTIKVLWGDAEIFGYELITLNSYTFKENTKFSIISWSGCQIEGIGLLEFAYLSKDNQCLLHLNINGCLSKMREEAKRNQSFGPIVLICGPTDVGKSTLCNTLLNYSTRLGYPLIFADLDVGQGEIAPQGCIGGVLVDTPFLVDHEISPHPPLIYYYGNNNINEQFQLYQHYISKLSSRIRQQLEKSSRIKAGGVIINCCGFIIKTGLEAIKQAINDFKANVVIVIDNELLYTQLQSFNSDTCSVVPIPKSGGSIPTIPKVRQELRKLRTTQYFYGLNKEFHPYTFPIKFDEIKIVKVGLPDLPEYCLPLGEDTSNKYTSVVNIEPTTDILYHLCGVSFAKNQDEVCNENIAGLVVITEIDIENKVLTIFSPAPAPLPGAFLIIGLIKYLDG